MNGPVPVGSALNKTAEFAHIGCSAKTLNAKNHVSKGCPISFMPTNGQGLVFPVGIFFARNNPREISAHGVVAAASMSRKCTTGTASPCPVEAQATPAIGAITRGFFASALKTTSMARPRCFSFCRPTSMHTTEMANKTHTTINEEMRAGCNPAGPNNKAHNGMPM